MIKGTTVIELTDTKTNQKEIIKEENMCTNVIRDIFDCNIDGLLFNINNAGNYWSEKIVPICPNSIGGILLFSDNIEEDADKYYAPSNNPCVGYASNDVNSSENTKRGSLNLNESKMLDNGYKFVWDFSTSQANGIISAMALTHRMAGKSYFGDMYLNDYKICKLREMYTTTSLNNVTAYINAVEVNFDENFFYSIGLNSSSEVVIRKIKKSYRNIGLNDTMLEDKIDLIEEVILTMTQELDYSSYHDFIDGKDGYWYGFWHYYNKDGDANIYVMKIKKDDYSFSEEAWIINNAYIGAAGYRTGYDSKPQRTIYSVIRDGYLYMMAYNQKGIYKINLNNHADVKLISFGFTSSFSYASRENQVGGVFLVVVGDWIMGSDFLISIDDTVYRTSDILPFEFTCTPLFQYGPFLMSYGKYYRDAVKKNLWLLTPYLATINNLGSPVVKTADKTMKITYTITENE